MNILNFKKMDPFILVSVLNTKLRDFNPSLQDLCSEHDIDINELETYLLEKGFSYNEENNQIK